MARNLWLSEWNALVERFPALSDSVVKVGTSVPHYASQVHVEGRLIGALSMEISLQFAPTMTARSSHMVPQARTASQRGMGNTLEGVMAWLVEARTVAERTALIAALVADVRVWVGQRPHAECNGTGKRTTGPCTCSGGWESEPEPQKERP